jgi:hypothetical protein
MEIWTTLQINPDYEISDQGNLRHKVIKKIKNLTISRSGSTIVTLRLGPKKHKTHTYTSLIRQLMPPRPSSKHQLCHINGNRQDYRLKNLAWMTQSEVMLLGIRLGKRHMPPNPRDTRYLTKAERNHILTLHVQGKSQCFIGRCISRHHSTISKFLKRQRQEGKL